MQRRDGAGFKQEMSISMVGNCRTGDSSIIIVSFCFKGSFYILCLINLTISLFSNTYPSRRAIRRANPELSLGPGSPSQRTSLPLYFLPLPLHLYHDFPWPFPSVAEERQACLGTIFANIAQWQLGRSVGFQPNVMWNTSHPYCVGRATAIEVNMISFTFCPFCGPTRRGDLFPACGESDRNIYLEVKRLSSF